MKTETKLCLKWQVEPLGQQGIIQKGGKRRHLADTGMLSVTLSKAVVWQSSSQSNRITGMNAVRSQAIKSP